jgi:carboxymethylenebutenolidase
MMLMHSTIIPALVVVHLVVACALAQQPSIPPSDADAKTALERSPRHGEWTDVAVPGRDSPVKCYVVFPEASGTAPVVIVIHEIFGLTDWIRGVADQLAADGFIAIAPDLLSGMGKDGGGTESFGGGDDVRTAIRALKPDDVTAALDAVREHGAKLPASNGKTATIGFCWGGRMSFHYATAQPELAAAVVYYGTSPADPGALAKISAPVLGLYGADDARVNRTIEPADAEMKTLGKTFVHHIYDGAGHGFLRQQDGRDGANLKAAQQAWPVTIQFLREHTRSD